MMLSLRRFPLVLFFSVWLLFGSAFLLSFLVYLSLSSPSLYASFSITSSSSSSSSSHDPLELERRAGQYTKSQVTTA